MLTEQEAIELIRDIKNNVPEITNMQIILISNIISKYVKNVFVKNIITSGKIAESTQ